MMSALSLPARDKVLHLVREVSYDEAVPAVELSPSAGASPRMLTTIGQIGAFLQPIDNISSDQIRATVNYVNPVGLAGWVRDTLGDDELGEALALIAADGRAYGLQVHDLKRVIVERLEQYEQVLQAEKVDPN